MFANFFARQLYRPATRERLSILPLHLFKATTPLKHYKSSGLGTRSKHHFGQVASQRCLAAMTTLISFDIDGTLITSKGEAANKLHKRAFSHAFKEVFDLDTHIDIIQHHGSTDPLILVAILMHHGIPKETAMERLPKLKDSMVRFWQAHQAEAGQGLLVLPGVVELLTALQERGDVVVSLVTGNLEAIAWGKMQALGLAHLFSEPHFGGFGSDTCSGNIAESWRDRAELVRVANKRGAEAAESTSGRITAKFHIGDTPMDLQAAQAGGAQGIGVTTGVYSREQLAAAGTDAVILDGLKDVPTVLEALNLVR